MLDLSNINWDSIASDGADIRVTDNDGTTLLSIWLEEFDYGAQTGKLWIKLPSTNSGDLYLYTFQSLIGKLKTQRTQILNLHLRQISIPYR